MEGVMDRRAGPESLKALHKVSEYRDEFLAPLKLIDPEVVPTRLFGVRDVGPLSMRSSQGHQAKVSEARRQTSRKHVSKCVRIQNIDQRALAADYVCVVRWALTAS